MGIVSDCHYWTTWENYKNVHDVHLNRHTFVLEDNLEWSFIEANTLQRDDFPTSIVLSGTITCASGVAVLVYKTLETRIGRQGMLEVQGQRYGYNAYFVNRHNILRYDNGHLLYPDDYHRHAFDLVTGKEIERMSLTREDMPTLVEFLDEVEQLVLANAEQS
jgi:hypothetical protein